MKTNSVRSPALLSFASHSKGVYLEISAPEVDQTLADLRSVTLADVSVNDVILA